MRAALHGLGAVDMRPVLPAINMPTLLLYGDADVRSPVSIGEQLQARIPGPALVVMPGRRTRPAASSPVISTTPSVVLSAAYVPEAAASPGRPWS